MGEPQREVRLKTKIRRNRRTKYPKVIIKHDLTVTLSVPYNFSDRECSSLIESNRAWVDSKIAKFEEKILFNQKKLEQYSGKILIFGEEYALLEGRKNELTKHSIEYRSAYSLKKMLRTILLNYLEEKADAIAANMGTTYSKINSKKTTSRWGSCTIKNVLNFSSLLLFAPKFVVDYVITHEMAHTVHKNHSRKFWNLVEEQTADTQRAKEWLRANHALLMHMGKYI